MEDIRTETNESMPLPRTMNETMAQAAKQKPQASLFDGFWRAGEVALLFGAAGVGKSVLAVQIADALARGRPLIGLDTPQKRHKVLYVDLNLSDVQFQMRYTAAATEGAAPKPYKFPQRLYRAAPRHDEDLCSWMRSMVRLHGFEVLIIDDLSAVKRTDDGTLDSLRIIREMKRVSQTEGVSILVLADSIESPRHVVAESDLRRCRVICGVADSVFAIGRGAQYLNLVHFRSQSGEVVRGVNWPINCKMLRFDSSLLGFVFEDEFARSYDDATCRLICGIRQMHAHDGKTLREIAQELGISKSRVGRLNNAFTDAVWRQVNGDEPDAATGSEDHDDEDYDDNYEDDDREDGNYDDDDHEDEVSRDDVTATAPAAAADAHSPWYERIDVKLIPFAAALGRRSMYDLELEYNEYDRPVYVEARFEYNGKRRIWYDLDSQGRTIRWVHNGLGPSGERVGKSGWI